MIHIRIFFLIRHRILYYWICITHLEFNDEVDPATLNAIAATASAAAAAADAAADSVATDYAKSLCCYDAHKRMYQATLATDAADGRIGDAIHAGLSAVRNASDAADGRIGDAIHAGLSAVRNASSALINGLELGGCVGGASSASGTQLGEYSRDPRSSRAGKSASSVSATTSGFGSIAAKRTETKQARKGGSAKTAKRTVSKSLLAVDGEDTDCSDDE